MGLSSRYWAGFCVNLQILCENLVIAAGAPAHEWDRGDTTALGTRTGHQPPELPALMELDNPMFPLSLAQLPFYLWKLWTNLLLIAVEGR